MLHPANTARALPNSKLQGADSRTDSRMMRPVVPNAPLLHRTLTKPVTSQVPEDASSPGVSEAPAPGAQPLVTVSRGGQPALPATGSSVRSAPTLLLVDTLQDIPLARGNKAGRTGHGSLRGWRKPQRSRGRRHQSLLLCSLFKSWKNLHRNMHRP